MFGDTSSAGTKYTPARMSPDEETAEVTFRALRPDETPAQAHLRATASDFDHTGVG
jgi:hypothetical protein